MASKAKKNGKKKESTKAEKIDSDIKLSKAEEKKSVLSKEAAQKYLTADRTMRGEGALSAIHFPIGEMDSILLKKAEGRTGDTVDHILGKLRREAGLELSEEPGDGKLSRQMVYEARWIFENWTEGVKVSSFRVQRAIDKDGVKTYHPLGKNVLTGTRNGKKTTLVKFIDTIKSENPQVLHREAMKLLPEEGLTVSQRSDRRENAINKVKKGFTTMAENVRKLAKKEGLLDSLKEVVLDKFGEEEVLDHIIGLCDELSFETIASLAATLEDYEEAEDIEEEEEQDAA